MTIKCKVSGIPEVKEAFRFGWFLFRILIVNNFILIREINRPFLSSLVPLFQRKSKARVKRCTSHEPNQVQPIRLM